jgi:hypothetical protein
MTPPRDDDVRRARDRPPILFLSRLREPGEFDPLATQPQKALTDTVAAGAEQPAMGNRPSAVQGREDEG